METWAVILAGGSGRRFGGPKQFEALGDQRVIDHSLTNAKTTCDGIVVVVPQEHFGGDYGDATVVVGGDTHFASAVNGVAAVPGAADAVLIVTVSHPLATKSLYRRLIATLDDDAHGEIDAVFPSAPLPDALKHMQGAAVAHSVDKSRLVAAQAPSIFRATQLRSALALGQEAPEELELIERIGGRVVAIEGEATNLHITTPLELDMARAILALLLSE